jgi:hypothetical protein
MSLLFAENMAGGGRRAGSGLSLTGIRAIGFNPAGRYHIST